MNINLLKDPIEELYMWEEVIDVTQGPNSPTLDRIRTAIVGRQALGDTVSPYPVEDDLDNLIPAQRVTAERTVI